MMPINDDPRTQAKRQNDADDRKVDNPLANFDGLSGADAFRLVGFGRHARQLYRLPYPGV
jgi:hypothetical protein